MKKGFLFGLGVLIAGGVLAASISTVSIGSKNPGGTVTSGEFNQITSGVISLTKVFEGTTSNDTTGDITLTNDISAPKVSAPEICLNSDCQTAWPAGGAGGVTAMDCPEGQQLQSVTTAGVFTCGVDQTAAGGTGDNMGDHVVLQDLLPEMTGATPLMGNPPGSPSVVSTRNIGSATKWFKELWVEDLHVGNQTLYLNGVAVLESDPMIEMKFTADDGQKMSISTFGDGAEMAVHSSDNLNLGITEDAADDKALTITNNSTNGSIEIATPVDAISTSQIKIESKNIRIGREALSKTGVNLPSYSIPAYTLDVNGDINFTGTLYENGVAFSGGTGGTADNLGNHTATQSILPNGEGAYDIGSASKPFNDVYASSVTAGEFCLNGGGRETAPNCITSFPSGTGVTAITCPTGYSLKAVNSSGTFTCALSTTPVLTTASSICNESHVGETRVNGPLAGGVTYAFQVCMLQNGEWYWITLVDSGTGIQPAGTGTCSPDTGICT